MPKKKAKDFPKTLSHFGINIDDDDQIAAIDQALKTDQTYSFVGTIEWNLNHGGVVEGTYSFAAVQRAFGAALQAKGIRPEELRR